MSKLNVKVVSSNESLFNAEERDTLMIEKIPYLVTKKLNYVILKEGKEAETLDMVMTTSYDQHFAYEKVFLQRDEESWKDPWSTKTYKRGSMEYRLTANRCRRFWRI